MKFNYNFVAMETFGHWIRRHRKELRMYQSDVAKRAGVSTSYISTLERGQKHSITNAELTPNRAKVIAIAAAVGGDPSEALELVGYARLKESEARKPQNIAEFLEALENMGLVFGPGLLQDPRLENYTPDEFQEFLERITRDVRNEVEYNIEKKGKDRI